MLEIIKHFTFEAAHHLYNYDGPCSRIHGHSYKLDIGVCATHVTLNDMIMDFKQLKEIVEQEIIDRWDHQLLNDLPEFNSGVLGTSPTAEMMVGWIVSTLEHQLSLLGVRLTLVDLWETEDSHCRWSN